MKKEPFEGIFATLGRLEDELLQMAAYQGYDGIDRLILILEDDPPSFFEALQPLIHFLRRRRLPQPLVLPRTYVENALDSFPLEFYNIKSSYRNLVVNTDILGRMSFEKSDIRLQMERELRGKWLLTRQAILENPYRIAHLRSVVLDSRVALHPVLKGFFALSDQAPPKDLKAAIDGGSRITGLDLSPLDTLIQGINQVNQYLDMLSQLSEKIQNWQL